MLQTGGERGTAPPPPHPTSCIQPHEGRPVSGRGRKGCPCLCGCGVGQGVGAASDRGIYEEYSFGGSSPGRPPSDPKEVNLEDKLGNSPSGPGAAPLPSLEFTKRTWLH
eukprot:scaffold1322_cov372-Pavlova_lutheri.AAC.14